MNETAPKDLTSFDEFDVGEDVKSAVRAMGFTRPTPVQVQTIPPMLDGLDVIAKAPTGTGKTCAFGIPIVECLSEDCPDIQAVVLCPTRELCTQITDELRLIAAGRPGIRIVSLYGGQPIGRQLDALKKHPQVVVATPGRMLDHMSRGTAFLGNVYTAVLDEADEMLDMGFIKDVRRILNATPADTQVVMFSATISREVMDVSWEYQHSPVQINIESEGDNRPHIAQFQLPSIGGQRLTDMLVLIKALDLHRVMVFANRKSTVKILDSQLKRLGCSVDCLHGDIPQSQRNQVMRRFREGKFEMLVATDVAARGIDVDDVECVFNYDIPDENEYYVHRIGRTGRAKRHGMAFTFVSADDKFKMRDISKYTHSDIEPIRLREDGVPVTQEEIPLTQWLTQQTAARAASVESGAADKSEASAEV